MSAVEIASSLTFKYTSLIKKLKAKGVTVSIAIVDDTFSYGYVGTSKSSINQHVFSKEITSAISYMVSSLNYVHRTR